MDLNPKKIDIIIPCFNEELNIISLVNEIDKSLANTPYFYRLVFVDDGSTDSTCSTIKALANLRDNVSLIKLSRNFGKEAAMSAGLKHCSADAVILIDSDLQHPPYLMRAMISEWEKGAHVVDAVKIVRSGENIIRTLVSRIFNTIFSSLTGIDFGDASDYKLLDIKAVAILNNINEKTRFFRGLTNWIGLVHTKVEFKVEHRNAGKTKWNLFRLFRLSFDAITSYSQKPLQIITVLGIFTLLFSLILGIQTLYNKLVGNAVSGFTTVICIILISTSFIMIALGIMGIYLSKVYDEVKGRPVFVIEDVVGSSKTKITDE